MKFAVETKFNFHDKAWRLALKIDESFYINCPVCGGEGYLVGHNLEHQKCTKCKGEGILLTKKKSLWYPVKVTIQSISVNSNGSIINIKYQQRFHPFTEWSEQEVFATEKEAIIECAKRNKEKREGE